MATPGVAVSVDGATGANQDNGYLENARAFLAKAYGSLPVGHENVAQAFSNLDDLSNRSTHVHLVGHGSPGTISAGTGMEMVSKDTYTGFNNLDVWGPIVNGHFEDFSSISLWSCSSARNKLGEMFLVSLAEKSGATCHGLSGNLVCHATEGFTLLKSSEWSTAEPDGTIRTRPAARAPIPPRELPIVVKVDKQVYAIDRSQVVSMAAHGVVAAPLINSIPLDQFMGAFDFSNPLSLGGAPSGRETGRVQLEVNLPGTGRRTMEFAVFNHSLLWDRETGVYYESTTLFGEFQAAAGIVASFTSM